MRRWSPLAMLAILLAVAGIGALLAFRTAERSAPEAAAPTVVGDLPSARELVTGLQPAAVPEETASATEPAPIPPAPREEEVSTPSVGYLPPPNRNLTGSSLGRQAVPLPKEIGDIHQIYYHTPTLTLFMAVTE